MSSHRIDQINSLIQHELGAIIARQVEVPAGTFLTISKVETTADLKQARVWVSIYPTKFRGTVLERLRRARHDIIGLLLERLVLNPLPTVVFKVDESLERAERINRLIDGQDPDADGAP